MDTINFSKDIPPEQLAEIFRNYFEQHMAAYYILQGMQYGGMKVTIDKASLMYSVHLLSPDNKERIVENLQRQNTRLHLYGKVIEPYVFLNGDLLCITINK